jgi:hypothetical protein
MRYAAEDSPAVPNQVNWTFVDGEVRIDVLGYEVAPASLEPGSELEVTLYLSTPGPISDTYSLGLWLVSAVPGDTTRLAGLDTWPGDGNYPTTAWQPGEIIVDAYRIPIPADVPRAQAWLVQLNAFQMGEDTWLPVIVDGQAGGDRAVLGVVRVGASIPIAVPPASQLDPVVVFGNQIAMRGAAAAYDASVRQTRVELWWDALESIPSDLTVFVHLVDEDQRVVANGDGPPLEGGFPTSMWEAGDQIADPHVIPVTAELPEGQYAVVVGWYDPSTGARLATEDGNSVLIGEPVRVR